MRISENNSNIYKNFSKKQKNTHIINSSKLSGSVKGAVTKAKTGAIAALFLLPTLGIVKNCTNQNNNTQDVTAPADTEYRQNYLDIGQRSFYSVQKGDNPEKIARKFNVSTRRLLFENGLSGKDYIHPGDTLLIPESYTVKDIKNLKDVSKLTGLTKEFLEDLCSIEKVYSEVYLDRNNNKTIGVGHLVKPHETEKFADKTLSKKEIFSLLAQDLVNFEMDLKTVINESSLEKMPVKLRESVIDLAFNKGIGAISGNKVLCDALNNDDYEKAVSHLNQDYSVVVNAKGEKIKKPASGLSKRRLFDIKNACAIFEGKIPDEVLKSAENVYQRGLVYMSQERDRGEIPQKAYENVLAEYKNLAYIWFDGAFGEPLKNTKENEKTNTAENPKVQSQNPDKMSTKIRTEGKKTEWTVSSLYEDWQKNAQAKKRTVKRPLPEIDENGNIKAFVKIYEPASKGDLNNKIFIINPGHGGAVNHNGNLNFDPGTSNAVMDSKNKNLETNNFIGNGGVALEEWVVNQRIADELVKKITNAGAKVIYVQGSVYSAMDAIRDIQKEYNIDMILSLHSNSIGAKRGLHIISNKRNGVDKEDRELAKTLVKKFNEHSWFRGITNHKSQSLGVLSVSPEKTSSVPGVLIETGNLKNEKDVANLNSSKFKSEMIELIFEGIKDYLK